MLSVARGPWVIAGMAGLLLLGGRLPAAEGAASPPAKAPAAQAAPEQLAEKLIAQLLAPLPAVEPTPEQKAEIQKTLKAFASDDFKVREEASASAARLGTWALAAMRGAAAGPDLEVAERARLAAEAIEKAAREATTAELRKLTGVSEPMLKSKLEEARRTWANLAMGASEAERKENTERARKLQADIEAADKCVDALKKLLESVAGPASGPAGGQLSSGISN